MSCVAHLEIAASALSGRAGDHLDLSSKEVLFSAGDAKTHIYRVERGVVCLYDPRWNGVKSHVEFVFPGEFVGLGFLENHTLSACAFVESRVVCLPLGVEDEIAAADPKAEAKLAEAVEREFEARRDALSDAGASKPVERLAALLVNLSASNRYEGRDPSLITDSWTCGAIADMLGLAVGELSEILVDLARRGLIEPDLPRGLRLIDIDALEAIADGAAVSSKVACKQWSRPPRIWSAAA